jgi:mannosidase alpha-like ER degradation enhancer 2
VVTGKWTAVDAGIGAGVDSYFEYLLKGGILLGRPNLISMFEGIRDLGLFVNYHNIES